MFGRVRHYSHVLESTIVELLPYRLDLPIDHGRGCNDVSAGAGMAYRDLSELWKRLVIVYSAIADQTAVSMARILTHADVSQYNQLITELCFQITDRSLDYPVRVICPRSDFI